ncbi:MAG TPA: acyltransferase domain-containing protein, partial [Longimicrobium sp.]
MDDRLRSVAFLFPGVGDQYPQMARGLYESEPAFRAEVDRCAEILRARFGIDLLSALYPGDAPAESAPGAGVDLRAMLSGDAPDPAAEALNRTGLAQPAVFVIEYALAKLWMSWGVVPRALIGHSLGEYAAATIAGVFALEDALELVTARGRMIQELPAGAMLAVPLSADAARPFLVDGAAVATVNAPELCTVAGTPEAVETVRARLAEAGHAARPLKTTHAFHSPQMSPLVEPLRDLVGRMRLRAPSIPLVSDMTGTWLTAEEATDPGYWARHIREPVQFERGAAELLKESGRVLLEVGPGQTLSTFIRQRPDAAGVSVIPTVRYPYDRTGDVAFALGALGRLWLAGITPDWAAFHDGERLHRVPLPTYPWERQRYWIDAPEDGDASATAPRAGKRADPAEWLYIHTWKRTPAVQPAADDGARWLVFHDGQRLGDDVAAALRERGRAVVTVRAGDAFGRVSAEEMVIRPAAREDYAALLDAVRGESPVHAIHLWSHAEAGGEGRAFASLALLAAALGHERERKARLVAVTPEAQDVTGGETIDPYAATLTGACSVVREEHPNVACVALDLLPYDRGAVEALVAEALSDARDDIVAIRRGRRWVRGFEPVRPTRTTSIGEGDVWLLAGSLGGRNELLARHLAKSGARLAIADPDLPDRFNWDAVVAARPEDDSIRRLIETVRELEAGGEVVAVRAHLYNAGQMEDAIAAAEQRFGRIDGVVISPSLEALGGFEALGDASAGEWARHFGILAQEMESLAAVLASRDPAHVLVESSLTPVLGGVGRARVAAAHAFVDAFAHRRSLDGARAWTALGWDRWFAPGEPAEGYGMTEDEAVAAFGHALSLAGEPHLLLSTGDVAARIAQAAHPAAPGVMAAGHARPELETEYFAP